MQLKELGLAKERAVLACAGRNENPLKFCEEQLHQSNQNENYYMYYYTTYSYK
jgi:hypothetical protein